MKVRIEPMQLIGERTTTYFVDYSKDGKEWLNYSATKNYAEAEKNMREIILGEVIL